MSPQQCVRCGHCTYWASTHWGINTCETERTTEDRDESPIIASCGGDETQDTKKKRRERESVTVYQYPARREFDKQIRNGMMHDDMKKDKGGEGGSGSGRRRMESRRGSTMEVGGAGSGCSRVWKQQREKEELVKRWGEKAQHTRET